MSEIYSNLLLTYLLVRPVADRLKRLSSDAAALFSEHTFSIFSRKPN